MEQPNLKTIGDRLLALLPRYDEKERRLSNVLIRELAKGVPVAAARLSELSRESIEDVQEYLDQSSLVFQDDEKRVVGFSGLAIAKTQHRFRVGGKDLYTWCAWDTLFLPVLLDQTAEMITRCPQTGDAIQVGISPSGIESMDPQEAVMSLLNPDPDKINEDVVKHFCHYVYFFKNRSAGEAWTGKTPGTFLVSLSDGFELGKRLAAENFGIGVLKG